MDSIGGSTGPTEIVLCAQMKNVHVRCATGPRTSGEADDGVRQRILLRMRMSDVSTREQGANTSRINRDRPSLGDKVAVIAIRISSVDSLSA